MHRATPLELTSITPPVGLGLGHQRRVTNARIVERQIDPSFMFKDAVGQQTHRIRVSDIERVPGPGELRCHRHAALVDVDAMRAHHALASSCAIATDAGTCASDWPPCCRRNQLAPPAHLGNVGGEGAAADPQRGVPGIFVCG